MLAVRLIGKFDIQCDGKPVILSSRAAQSLFAYLILTAGTLHRREKLAGMLWPDESEQKARTYLRNELWRIRKALPHASNIEYLLVDNLTVGFNQSSVYWLDAAALQKVDDTPLTDNLINTLSNYRGDLLPGFYEDWIVLEREHLHIIFEQKIACLLEMLEKEQRWRDILEWAERWISLAQAPEAAYRALLVAYDALGDHAKVISTYERCKQALRQLDLEPSEQTRALAFKRSSKIKVPVPLSSFIGREKEIKEVAKLFSKSRLVTLTGSGGVGKTRLAIQVVAEVLDLFPDGIWFLDLAPLTDSSFVPKTLASLIGLRESGEIAVTELLVNYFHSRTALIIFDNCEHLIDGCAQLIHSLVTSCKNLAVLATSREILRISGELTYRVPSLEIPNPDVETNFPGISDVEAVKLFVDRAVATSPGFVLNEQNAVHITRICQRLDGIPLAIELAAGRINMLSVEQILKHLDHRFELLTNGLRSALTRHRTLRATIEWSYELLSEKERVLFRRLAIFTNDWTLEAVEAICAMGDITSDETLELLSHLVNKSLITTQILQDEKRYHMLETLWEYANEKLSQAGEKELLCRAHLKYYLNLAEAAEPHLRKKEQIEWLKRLNAEHDNLRAALVWAMSKPSAEPVLRLIASLGIFWLMHAYWLEGAKWLDQALGRTWNEKSKAEKAARAKALYHRADIAWEIGELDIMKKCAESALTLCEEVEDLWGLAFSHALVAYHQLWLAGYNGTFNRSLEQSLKGFQRLGDTWGESLALQVLAKALSELGTRAECLEIMHRAIARARDSGDRKRIAASLVELVLDLVYDGEWDEAERFLEEAEHHYSELDSSHGVVDIGFLRTRILFGRGNFEKAKAEAELVIEHSVLVGERNRQSEVLFLLSLLQLF